MGVELEGACRGSSELFAKETYFFLCNPLVHTHVIYSKCILYLVGRDWHKRGINYIGNLKFGGGYIVIVILLQLFVGQILNNKL